MRDDPFAKLSADLSFQLHSRGAVNLVFLETR